MTARGWHGRGNRYENSASISIHAKAINRSGDDRNAQRLILWNQIQFIKNYTGGSLYYFIPYTSPNAAFADIRDFPSDKAKPDYDLVETQHVKDYSSGMPDDKYGALMVKLGEKGNYARNGWPKGDISVISVCL